MNFRPQESPVSEPLGWPYEVRAVGERVRDLPGRAARCRRCALKLWGDDATFTLKSTRIDNVLYPVEESRGYQARGDLWSPGVFRLSLRAGQAGDARRVHGNLRDDERDGTGSARSTRSAGAVSG